MISWNEHNNIYLGKVNVTFYMLQINHKKRIEVDEIKLECFNWPEMKCENIIPKSMNRNTESKLKKGLGLES